MRVGITLDLKTSLFSSGINQNGIYLGMLYKKLGWDVVLLSIDTDGKAGEELDLLKINNLELCKYADSLNTSFDLIIELASSVSTILMDRYRTLSPGIKLIKYKCGNELFTTTETILHSAHDKRKSKDAKVYKGPQADAIWVIPQMENTNLHFYGYLDGGNTNTTVVPFIWDPIVIESFQKTLKFPNWSKFREEIKISIMEPNLSIMKNLIIPTVISSRALDEGDINIREIISWSTDKLAENKDLIKLIRHGNPTLIKKLKVQGRKPTVTVLGLSDVVLSWQLENNLNYLYFDVAWLGYPVIHNANLCQDIGYYYENSNVDQGVEKLNEVMANHSVEYLQTMRDRIARYTIENPELLESYRKLTDEVLDGKFNRKKYDWETNSIKSI